MKLKVISEELASYPELKFFISTKEFGNLAFRHPTIPDRITAQNRKWFFQLINISPRSIVNVALEHGNKIFWVENEDRGRGSLKKSNLIYDGLATDQKNIYLMITVADCFPIFLYDPKKKIIGLIHAGWKGVLKNTTSEAIKLFIKKGSDPKNITAFIGPGIQNCHYSVNKKRFNQFLKKFGKKIAIKKKGKLWLDLPKAIQSQLFALGLEKSNVEISPLCTYCEKNLFSSFRRDKDKYIAQSAIFGRC